MKIFLIALLTFSVNGHRKAQTTEEEDPGIFDLEYDEEMEDNHKATSAAIDADQNNCFSFVKGGLKRCFPKENGESGPKVTNTKSLNSCDEMKGCHPKDPYDREIPETSDLEVSEMNTRDSRSCVCGVESTGPKGLIKNGTAVQPPNKYPWMVALQKNKNTFCGGTLITEQFILTAAHCLTEDAGEIKVAFVTNTSAVSPGPTILKVIPYPNYDEKENNHDIALLKLSRRIQCNSFTRPICLPRPGVSDNLGKEFVIAGWGSEGDGKGVTEDLMEAKVKRMPFRQCIRQFQKPKENFYCLIGVQGGPCEGDSGGPMFVKHRHRYYLFGVTSMHSDKNQCPTKMPFLYTKVPRYMTWIEREIKRSSRLL